MLALAVALAVLVLLAATGGLVLLKALVIVAAVGTLVWLVERASCAPESEAEASP